MKYSQTAAEEKLIAEEVCMASALNTWVTVIALFYLKKSVFDSYQKYFYTRKRQAALED